MTTRTQVMAIALLGCAVSVTGFTAVRQAEERSVERAVEEESVQMSERIGFDLAVRVAMLQRMEKRWERMGGMSRERWAEEVDLVVGTVAGYRAVEYVDPTGLVRWVEPDVDSENGVGSELMASSEGSEGMVTSRGSGVPDVVAPVELRAGVSGILVFAPLELPGRFDGWLVGIFRVDEFIEETHSAVAGYRVAIRHRGAAVYDSGGEPGTGFCASTTLEPVDPALTLEVCATYALLEEARTEVPAATLAAGLGFTGLACGLVAALGSMRERREQAARLASSVQRHAEALDRAHRELADLSYAVSHDLRTPLRAIDGYAALLAEGAPEEARSKLDRIRSNAQRMARQVDGLLEILRIARARPARQPVDITGLSQRILDRLATSAPERRFHATISPGLTVEGDPDLVRLILEALLENAWKFTAGRQLAHIEVGPHPGGFFVRDDGVGFDMAYADKLFRTFESLHRPGEFEGIGLGLAVAARAARSHGGEIRAEGRPGEGATFYVRLIPPDDQVSRTA